MNDFEIFIGDDTLSISEAMQKIDYNGNGVLFLINYEGKLVSCITDGDIRRWLLSGGKMDDAAFKASNHHPKYAYSVNEAKKIFHMRYCVAIPIVDKDMSVIDVFVGENIDDARLYSSLNIPIVINAGGKGTRLDPFTRVLPKPLIPVGEYPIIEHIIREYLKYDCNDFRIIVNYKKELIKAYFADSDDSYDITWYDEEKPLGTGGGLSLLRGELNSTFFFVNCDALLTFDYEPILSFHRQQNNVITMVCAYKNINIPYGVVETGVDGVIENMKEKPLISFLTNTGIYIVEPEVIDDIEDNVPIGFPDIVEMERSKGKKVAVFPVSESEWMDMGQLSELEKMRIKLYGE